MLVVRALYARQFTLHPRWLLVVRASCARQFSLHTWWLVGGASIVCMPDNLRCIHGGCWWYERRMPNNLQFTLHTRCLVSRTPDNLLYKHRSHCQLDEESSWWPATKIDSGTGDSDMIASETSTSLSAIIIACTKVGWLHEIAHENLYFHNITRSLTRFNHVDIQVVTIRLMTCQCVHSLRLAPRCC